jgi:IS30 family transposase
MYKQLNPGQRYELAVYLKAGLKKTAIAKTMKVDRSTIYRETKRNGGKKTYCASKAQERVNARKQDYFRKKKLDENMMKIIHNGLEKKWSPEQIRGRCKAESKPMVSHETIYQYIWKNKADGGNWWKHLRNSNKKYKKRYGTKDNRGQIANRISIEQRPELVNQKQRIGDWEIDTIIGKSHQGAIVTAVERKTNFMLMQKLNSKQAHPAKTAIINMFAPFKEHVFTITSDNGFEFTEHQQIAKKLNADYFFAHPYSSWERGLNEYQNKLVRQYIPKKTDFKNIETADIIEIQNQINNRPRKKLNFKTPNELFFKQCGALVT